MMFGPHAAEIAGQFYRDLLHKERISSQASGGAAPARAAHPY